MIYAFEFKTKTLSLDITVSDKYVEEIRIKNSDSKPFDYKDDMRLLSENDCSHLRHLSNLIDLLDNYFSHKSTDFCEIPVNFTSYSYFSEGILKALRNVKYGKTMSYKELANMAGYGKRYSRACATALSINKTPIIIPCHRIIYSGGKPGGYSSGGGVSLKIRLLAIEQNAY
ncbi:methylated-DNA--[protein]-cysteine S-methyltransferase [Candidatus Acidulodesulfobacterium sp. H_13]|uniref:methylated-DNA--[protein]-cysteine S-methyltransferase n=1 Tax=Candidatus Acidulodesulfobacterium sp. H_13 TaxID=3395470 RepID=UPI003AF7DE67